MVLKLTPSPDAHRKPDADPQPHSSLCTAADAAEAGIHAGPSALRYQQRQPPAFGQPAVSGTPLGTAQLRHQTATSADKAPTAEQARIAQLLRRAVAERQVAPRVSRLHLHGACSSESDCATRVAIFIKLASTKMCTLVGLDVSHIY